MPLTQKQLEAHKISRTRFRLKENTGSPYVRAKWATIIDLVDSGTPYNEAVELAKTMASEAFESPANDSTNVNSDGAKRAIKKNPPCVYVLTCLPSGKEYVGCTTRGAKYRGTVHNAWRARIRRAVNQGAKTVEDVRGICGENTNSPILIQEVISYPHDDQWQFTVLFTAPYEDVENLTKREIKKYLFPIEKEFTISRNSLYPNGLNAQLSSSPSKETRAKIAAAHTGSKASDETRAKLREAHKLTARCINAQVRNESKNPKMTREESKEKFKERIKQLWQDPEWREKMSKRSSDHFLRLWQDPEWREKKIEQMKNRSE
jgi:hypothetical protein